MDDIKLKWPLYLLYLTLGSIVVIMFVDIFGIGSIGKELQKGERGTIVIHDGGNTKVYENVTNIHHEHVGVSFRHDGVWHKVVSGDIEIHHHCDNRGK